MEKVYISAPLSLDWKTVDLFKRTIDNTFDVRVWDRNFNNFIESDFRLSDSVLFLLPNNGFQSSLSSLPIGVRKEAEKARDMKKKIYVGYITTAGDYNIYNASISSAHIEAISGTANSIFSNKKSYTPAENVMLKNVMLKNLINVTEKRYGVATLESNDPTNLIVFDNRLLLMLQ